MAEEVTLGVSVGGGGVWSVKEKFNCVRVSKAMNENVCKLFSAKALKNGAICLSLSIYQLDYVRACVCPGVYTMFVLLLSVGLM